jgi:membrane protease YdiL (CAAX protease family)
MKFILEFFAVFFVGILPSLLSTFLYLSNPNYLKIAEKYDVFEKLLNRWVRDLGSISVVLLVAYLQPNGFASVGLKFNDPANNIGAFFVGGSGLTFFLILLGIGQRIILRLMKQPSPPVIDTANPWVTDSLHYQSIWERLAYLAVLPFSAISEEFIYRGYLVLFLGTLTNTFIPWAVISIVLTVVLHLYQSRNSRTIILHFLLASFFVGLTISTQNILAPITAHIFLNLMNQLRLWIVAKEKDLPTPTANSNKQKLAYTVFIAANVIILYVSTRLLLV